MAVGESTGVDPTPAGGLPAPRWLTATANDVDVVRDGVTYRPDTLVTVSWAGAESLAPGDYQVYWDFVEEDGESTEILLRDTGNPRLLADPAQCSGSGSPGDMCVSVDVSDFLDRRFHTFRVRAYKGGVWSDPSPTAGTFAGPAPVVDCGVIIDGPATMEQNQQAEYVAYYRGANQHALSWLTWSLPAQLTPVGFTRNQQRITVIATGAGDNLEIGAQIVCSDDKPVTGVTTTTVTPIDPTATAVPTKPPPPRWLTASANTEEETIDSVAYKTGTVITLAWDGDTEYDYQITWFHVDQHGNRSENLLRDNTAPGLLGVPVVCVDVESENAMCVKVDVSHFPTYRYHEFRVYRFAHNIRSDPSPTAGAYGGPVDACLLYTSPSPRDS